MVLIDSQGNERGREMIVHTKDYGDLIKTLIRFTQPADIEGTGLLSWENKDRDDDQFLFLPELRRARRIASNKKDGKFVNSDFTYEDLEKRKVEKDEHRLLREEEFEGKRCYVVESIPKKGSGSQYTKLINWVVKDSFLPIKTEYYGKGAKLEKVYTAKKIDKIDDIWTVMEAEIADLSKKHRTVTKIEKLTYNTGISDDVFTKRYLEKY